MKKLNVLIAEDDESSFLYLSSVLRGMYSELLKASNGTDAVELSKAHPDIDLILMDIKIPLMDGYEVTRKIREFNQDVVIIAQTAYAMVGDREKAMEAGCTGYIAKPVDRETLKSLIRSFFPDDSP